MLADFKVGTIAWLIQRYIEEVGAMKAIGRSHMYSLQLLQKSPIGAVMAADLKASDVLAHARMRKQGYGTVKGVKAATINQDITYLRGPLDYAKHGFDLPEVTTRALVEAKPLLKRFQMIGKSMPRDRRPTGNEYERLMAYFQVRDTSSSIPMCTIIEFAAASARRISEIMRLRWGDVNGADMTCIVRDMKDPKNKIGNHHEFPLLGRAWDIVMAQPRLRPNDPDERIFPYNAKSAGQCFTRAKKELGIENLRFHDLRREAASRLFEQGYGVPEVMVVTGHKNPQMLIRTYTKLKASDLHKGPASKQVITAAPTQPEPRNA